MPKRCFASSPAHFRLVCSHRALYYLFPRSSSQIILPALIFTPPASTCVCTKAFYMRLRRRTSTRQTACNETARTIMKCIRLLAVHVDAQLSLDSSINHMHQATSMLHFFRHGVATNRETWISIVYIIPAASIKSLYSPNERLMSRFSSLFIVSPPPNTLILILVMTLYTH